MIPPLEVSDLKSTIRQLSTPPFELGPEVKPDDYPSLAHLDPSELPPGYEWDEENGYAVFKQDMIKSLYDDRSYKLIRLKNGFEAICVSDNDTDKSAAHLSVRAGSCNEPEHIPGLAHFFEHVLHLGSEKYPQENHYSDFIANNNGSFNAESLFEYSIYYFNVSSEAFEAALDIFAHMFISPLIKKETLEKEVNAVDSEFKGCLDDDIIRMDSVEKASCDPKHAYSRFDFGNLETLWNVPIKSKVEIRNELLDFFRKYYSANVMKLAVIDNKPLDVICSLVTKLFSGIPNRFTAPAKFPESLYLEKYLPGQLFVKSLTNIYYLELGFPYFDETALYNHKPARLVSRLLSGRFKGSLRSYLNYKQWAVSISASPSVHTGFSIFYIVLKLTKSGYDNYEQVIRAIFSYIQLLQTSDLKKYHDERLEIDKISFEHGQKARPNRLVRSLAQSMQKLEPRRYLLSFCDTVFDEKSLSKLLEKLTIQNCQVHLLSNRNHPSDGARSIDKWFGAEYSFKPIPESLLKNSLDLSIIHKLALPEANAFIPKNLSVSPGSDYSTVSRMPIIIRQNERIRVWHRKDVYWNVPEAAVLVDMKMPWLMKTCLSCVKCMLFLDLLQDSLEEDTYFPSVSGLRYKISIGPTGISILVNGFNDTLPRLIHIILNKLKHFKPDASRLEIYKDSLKRSCENFNVESPRDVTEKFVTSLIYEDHYLLSDLEEYIQDITLQDIQKYVESIPKQMFIEMFVHGNMSENQTLELADTIHDTFPFETIPEVIGARSLYPPTGPGQILYIDALYPEKVECAVEYVCYIEDGQNVMIHNCLSLFDQLTRDHTFYVLRTVQQLGYACRSFASTGPWNCDFTICVQGEKNAAFLEQRIREYIKSLAKWIQDMPAETFEEHKKSLLDNTTERFKDLYEEANHKKDCIITGKYDFDTGGQNVRAIKALTKQDVLELYRAYIDPEGPKRRKYSIHYQSRRLPSSAFGPMLDILNELNIKIPQEMTNLIQQQPTFDKFYKRLTDEFLPVMDIFEGDGGFYEKIIQTAKEIVDYKYPENETIFTNHHEMKKTFLLGNAPEPVRSTGFDLKAIV